MFRWRIAAQKKRRGTKYIVRRGIIWLDRWEPRGCNPISGVQGKQPCRRGEGEEEEVSIIP